MFSWINKIFEILRNINVVLKKIDLIIDMLIYLIDNLPSSNIPNKQLTLSNYINRIHNINHET